MQWLPIAQTFKFQCLWHLLKWERRDHWGSSLVSKCLWGMKFSIFAKCTRLTHLLSFGSLFLVVRLSSIDGWGFLEHVKSSFSEKRSDHHDHQDFYTYNLSGPKRFTLDVPNQSLQGLEIIGFEVWNSWLNAEHGGRNHDSRCPCNCFEVQLKLCNYTQFNCSSWL